MQKAIYLVFTSVINVCHSDSWRKRFVVSWPFFLISWI